VDIDYTLPLLTVATPGEWQCKIRLALANGPNIFQMLLVFFSIMLKFSGMQTKPPAYLVPVPSQDKLGGLQQEGHPE